MKRIWIVLLALLAAVLACTTEPTGEPPTITQPPTLTETQPSSTTTPTLTLPPPTSTLPYGGELIRNGGFEEFEYNVLNMTWDNADDGYPHITPVDWQVGYHAENYFAEDNPFTYYACADAPSGITIPEQCDEINGEGRRWDDKDGRPEFKIGIPDRAHSGNASGYWFSYYRPTVGWYQQEIYLPVSRDFDTECHAEFYQHWWITPGNTGLESLPPQPFAIHDDRLAAFTLAQVGIDWVYRTGDDELGSWQWRGDDVVYDEYADEPYEFDFVVPRTVNRIVLQIGGQANWGWQTQDYALDDVSLRCRGIDFPMVTPQPSTPTPVATVNPNPSETPIVLTPVGGDQPLGTAVYNRSANVRLCEVLENPSYPIYWFAAIDPTQACPVQYMIPAGTAVHVQDFFRDMNGDLWAGLALGDETHVETVAVCYDDQQFADYYHHWLGNPNSPPLESTDVCAM